MMRELKLRMTSVEAQAASSHTDMALIHRRIDRLDARLDRAERRLVLREEY